MASRAIFQYNVLTIDDTHNIWTNMIVKMTILRLLGSSDDKEKENIGVARQKGIKAKSAYGHQMNRRVKIGASVHWASYVPETMQVAQEPSLRHRLNR